MWDNPVAEVVRFELTRRLPPESKSGALPLGDTPNKTCIWRSLGDGADEAPPPTPHTD